MIVETRGTRNEDQCVYDVSEGKDQWGNPDTSEPTACGYFKWAHKNKDHQFVGHTIEREVIPALFDKDNEAFIWVKMKTDGTVAVEYLHGKQVPEIIIDGQSRRYTDAAEEEAAVIERVARALALSEGMLHGSTATDADFDECLSGAEQEEWRELARVALTAAKPATVKNGGA